MEYIIGNRYVYLGHQSSDIITIFSPGTIVKLESVSGNLTSVKGTEKNIEYTQTCRSWQLGPLKENKVEIKFPYSGSCVNISDKVKHYLMSLDPQWDGMVGFNGVDWNRSSVWPIQVSSLKKPYSRAELERIIDLLELDSSEHLNNTLPNEPTISYSATVTPIDNNKDVSITYVEQNDEPKKVSTLPFKSRVVVPADIPSISNAKNLSGLIVPLITIKKRTI